MFVCTESISIDVLTNRISCFHLFESIASPTFPLALPAFHVIALLEKKTDEPETYNLKTRWTLDGKEIANMDLRCDFQGSPRTRCIAGIGGIIAPQPGRLDASLMLDARKIASWEVALEGIAAPKLSQREISGAKTRR